MSEAALYRLLRHMLRDEINVETRAMKAVLQRTAQAIAAAIEAETGRR